MGGIDARLGFFAAIAAATLFGVGGSFAQFLFQQRGIDVGWLVTMRLLCAGGVLVLVAAIRQGRGILAIWRTDAVGLILFGLAGMMPVQYTYMAAIGASNTATATVLQFTAPAMIALWLAAMARRLPDRRAVLAIGLAMLGTFLLVTHGEYGALLVSPLALFWGLASAVAAAVNSLQPAGLLRRHDAASVAGWGMLVGGAALALLHPPWNAAGRFDPVSVAFLAFILLFGTLAAFYLYLKALRLIGAQTTSLLSCAEPLSAALIAVLWLGVPWGGMDWLGTLCVLATVALLARDQTAESQSEKIT